MQRFGRYLLANNLRAFFAVFISILIPFFPFNLIAASLVALVTLQCGVLMGLGALAWALLPSIATNIKFTQLLDLATHYDFAFILCLLAWGFAAFLRYTRNWSRVLELTAVLGVIIVVIIALLPPELVAPFIAKFKNYVLQASNQLVQLDSAVSDQFKQTPALVLFGWMYAPLAFLALLSLVVARMWQLLLTALPQKRSEFYHIRMGRIAATVAGVLIAIALLTKVSVLIALMPVSFILFTFAGLSLVRFVVATKIKSALSGFSILIIVFLLILFVPLIAVVLLTILCIADSWIDLRRTKLLAQ